jgi:amidophosphoribosyltransferase
MPDDGFFNEHDDHMHEECGVFGVFNHPMAGQMTYLGLYALQHRGQESSGIAVSNEKTIIAYKRMGLVNRVFSKADIFDKLPGIHALGHNRYSTTGSSIIENAQPILVNCRVGQIAAAHNGNLTNARSLRSWMEDRGSIFISTTDTAVVMHLIARSRRPVIDEMILEALSQVKGSYSMLFMTPQALYGCRDPRGVRPLILGKCNDSYFLSSETCSFDLVGAEMIREVEPGEMVRIDKDGVTSFRIPTFERVDHPAHCVFEFIYFSRPDSYVFGSNVDKIRRRLGRQLAKEYPVEADLVMGVPDSATTAALGYAEESRIRFDIGLIRNHYIGRTFIQPVQSGRDFGVRIKFNPVKGVLKGKRVIIVDDSIVRGTTMKKIIKLIKTAEPREIHLRISSPPVISPCFYGIDMPTKEELIGSNQTVEQIRNYLEVDSLGYLSMDGLRSVVPSPAVNFCAACFTGDYPIKVDQADPSSCG